MHLEIETEGGNFPAVGAIDIPWETWFHAAMVYDGSTLTEYLNGVKGAHIPAFGRIKNILTLLIGNSHNSENFLTGEIDDISIYQCALTQSEIQKLSESVITGDLVSNTDADFTIYPTVADQELFINLANPEEYMIEFIDMVGVTTGLLKVNLSMDISNLNSGVYIVKLTNKINQTFTFKKIIKGGN